MEENVAEGVQWRLYWFGRCGLGQQAGDGRAHRPLNPDVVDELLW